ncbi:MAG: hypothetical protein V4581_17290 [Bacteroidota bacterium]
MKKLLLLPALALFLFSCSSDTEDLQAMDNHSNARAMQLASQVTNQIPTASLSCFKNLGAHTEIDLSDGFGNGTINFIADAPSSAMGSYKALVEIEQISDCENLEVGTGNIKTFSTGVTYNNIYSNAPVISGIAPSQTFNCYRWRMVLQGVNKTGGVSCTTTSQWYEAPLF